MTAAWTLDHGQLQRDGEPILTLVRAVWGDGAPPAAEIAALERRIVALLNAAEPKPSHGPTIDDLRSMAANAHARADSLMLGHVLGNNYDLAVLVAERENKRCPHPFRHPSTARNGACLDCGEFEEDGPHTTA